MKLRDKDLFSKLTPEGAINIRKEVVIALLSRKENGHYRYLDGVLDYFLTHYSTSLDWFYEENFVTRIVKLLKMNKHDKFFYVIAFYTYRKMFEDPNTWDIGGDILRNIYYKTYKKYIHSRGDLFGREDYIKWATEHEETLFLTTAYQFT